MSPRTSSPRSVVALVVTLLIAAAGCSSSPSSEDTSTTEIEAEVEAEVEESQAESTTTIDAEAEGNGGGTGAVIATDGGGDPIDFGAEPRSVAYCGPADPGAAQQAITILHGRPEMVAIYLDFLTGDDPDRLETLDEAAASSLLLVQAPLTGTDPDELAGSITAFLIDTDVPEEERAGEYAVMTETTSAAVSIEPVLCEVGSDVVLTLDVSLDSELQSDLVANVSGSLSATVVDGSEG